MNISLYYGKNKHIINNVEAKTASEIIDDINNFIIEVKGGPTYEKLYEDWSGYIRIETCKRTVHAKDFRKLIIFENEFTLKNLPTKEDVLVYVESISGVPNDGKLRPKIIL